MDRGTWQATVHGVTKSRAQLSDSHTKKPVGPEIDMAKYVFIHSFNTDFQVVT